MYYVAAIAGLLAMFLAGVCVGRWWLPKGHVVLKPIKHESQAAYEPLYGGFPDANEAFAKKPKAHPLHGHRTQHL
jgi:hypothetical protein